MSITSVRTASGRSLAYSDSGGGTIGTLVFHAGTPDGLATYGPFAEAVADVRMRLVSIARPGYESSTRHPGRSVADAVDDVEVVLDSLGIGEYVAMGWSGGGPHALACRAVSPSRCTGAVLVASIAPFGVPELDFFDGMGADNAVGFRLAVEGETSLVPYLEQAAPAFRHIGGDDLHASLETLLPETDRAHLSGEFAEYVAECLRRGVAHGIDGWVDDCLAFARDWGFDVEGVERVSIWHGADDLMVPFGHGRWLANALGPGADRRLLYSEGHLTILVGRIEEVVDDAARLVR